MQRVLLPAMVAGSFLVAGQALAASATGSFNATMTITADCRVSSSPNLAFGSSGVWTSAVTAQADLEVQCTNGTDYQIGLGFSANASGSQRRMKHSTASEYINYDLFTDAGLTDPWGDTIDTDTKGHSTRLTGNGQSQLQRVYGRVPVQAVSQPGAYSDTITVTVTY